MKTALYFVFLIFFAAIGGAFMYFETIPRNGPDVKNPAPFWGCYRNGKSIIKIDAVHATSLNSGRSTQIKRIFILKDSAAINTTGDLDYNVDKDYLAVGEHSTGFFYRFDIINEPKAILIPNNLHSTSKFVKSQC